MVDPEIQTPVRPAVGDEMVVRYSRRGSPHVDQTVTIVRVDRRWVYFTVGAPYAREERFDIETGMLDGGGYTSPGAVRTAAEWTRRDHRRDQLSRLRQSGLTIAFDADLSDAQVDAIAAVLDATS